MSLTNPRFDYSQVSQDVAGKLRYFEAELLRSRKRVAEEVIKHGEILHEVQQALASYSSGTFVAWLESCGISQRSAYNAIDAYISFASFANLQNLEVSAMYVLAKNEEAKKRALRLANKGVKVTHAMAKELVESYQEPPETDVPAEEDETEFEEMDGEMEVDEMDFEESAPGPSRSGKEKPGDSYSEPDPKQEFRTQRSKTIKTVDALMRALDDLNQLTASPGHQSAISRCKWIRNLAKEWK